MSLAFTAEQFRRQAPRPTKDTHSRLRELGNLVLLCLLFAPLTYTVQRQLPPWTIDTARTGTVWLHLLVAVPVSIYLTVAVHEAGHLFAALALGYRFVLVRVGMVGLAQEVGGLRLRRIGSNLFAMRGSTVVLTTVTVHHRWRELLVLAGGPVAQALLLGGLLGLCRLPPAQPAAPWFAALLHTLVFLTLIALSSSIIPLRVGMVATDAHHILRLLRGGPEVERQLLIQRLTAHAFFDTAYADLDSTLLAAACRPHTGSRNDYAAHLLGAAVTLAQNQIAAAGQHLNQVLAFVYDHPTLRQAGWPFLYAARYELKAGADVQAARQWLALLVRQEESCLAVDHEQARLHVEAMLLAAEGKVAAAHDVAIRSLRLLPRRLDWGCTAAEQKSLHALVAQTKERQIASLAVSPPAVSTLPALHARRILLQTSITLIGFIVICALF